MNNKGQSILSEYVMIFFVVIAAAVAVTTFVQRGFEARIHDARNFMVSSVVSSGACDANCLAATGAQNGQISPEYEPYYSITLSNVGHNQSDKMTTRAGNSQSLGSIYSKTSNEATATGTTSYQMPPTCANGGC